MHSGFVINRADGRPMYLQIIEQIKERIAVGDWPVGAEIPSIRQLAIDLEVSVITVKRAYLELEREGVINTQQGRGSRVADTAGLAESLREKELQQHLEEAMRIAGQLGMTPNEVEERLKTVVDRLAEKEPL